MSTVAEKQEVSEIRDLITKSRPLYKKYEQLAGMLTAFASEFRTFETELTILLNARESYEKRRQNADLELARVEQQAKSRMATLEHGHRTVMDELGRKVLAADAKMAEAQKLELKAQEAIANNDLLRASLEKLKAELTSVKSVKK